MVTVYLSLGSNLGDREGYVEKAISKIAERVGLVTARSSLYNTRPWGYVSCHDYVNACVKVETRLSPRQLLAVTQDIERELGRTRKSVDGNYSDRVIDIDILLYDKLTIREDDLVIPHPLMLQRDFVMRPLREICPDL